MRAIFSRLVSFRLVSRLGVSLCPPVCLQYRNKLNEQQHSQLTSQTETLGQRRDEMARIDQRIAELQQRLHRKRVHNQQLASQLHAASAAKRQVRQTSAKTLPPPAVFCGAVSHCAAPKSASQFSFDAYFGATSTWALLAAS